MLKLFKKKSENTLSLESNKVILPFKKPAKKFFFNLDTSAEKSNELALKARHYPPANQEWSNSIYAYNKNLIKPLPVTDNLVYKILNSYFNLGLFHAKIKKKAKRLHIRSRRLRRRSRRTRIRFIRRTINRIFLSRAEMKHTNNKVIITVYTYNRNLKYLYYKIRKLISRIKRKKINMGRK